MGPPNPTARAGHAHLQTWATQIAQDSGVEVLQRSTRVPPSNALRGAGALGSAALAYDAYNTTRETTRLLDQGNVTGAQSQVLHFGGRTAGGVVGGFAAGAAYGAATGAWTGPGAIGTGLAGGALGAVAGDKIMDAVDQSRIYSQRGSDGHVWKFDPAQPQTGWTRLPLPGEFGPEGPPSVAAGGPVYKNHQLQASPRLADELNYKASSVAVELALARGPALQDPFRQPPSTTGEAVRPGVVGANAPWIRDPQSQAWTRQTLEPATPMSHGMPVQRTVTASPAQTQTQQLDRAAQATIADNIAHGPLAIAERYQSAYEQHGWKQHGPVPEAVRSAAQTPPGQLPASDGHTYTQGKNGQWTTPGSLYGTNSAQTSVRDELDATRQQVRAQPQAQPVADRPTPPQIERITTHESRIAPTPGGMRFAEAHKRRDDPEQISPGSLQPVGKLDLPASSKGSVLHRAHQASEQNLMRGLGIAQAQDKERFRNEPLAQSPSMERTQERMPRRVLDEAPVQKQPAPSAPAVPAPGTVGMASPVPPVVPGAPVVSAPARAASSRPVEPVQAVHAREHIAATPAPSRPTALPDASDSHEMQARLVANEAELAAARAQIARLTDRTPDARAQPAAPPRQPDPRDPTHPHHQDFQKIYGVVAQDGRWDARQSTRIASQALADFKADPLATRLDVVVVQPDTRGQLKLFVGCAPWGGQRCLSIAVVDPVQAANVPPEQGFERLAQTMQQRELQEAQQWSQQPSQQQGNALRP